MWLSRWLGFRLLIVLTVALGSSAEGLLSTARGDESAPELAIPGREMREHHALPPARSPALSFDQTASGSGGWWLGTVGIALALAAFGAMSIAARRALPGRTAGSLAIVSRLHLSPKHAVYLLRAGEQMLVVGTGAQGPPALLGEWTEMSGSNNLDLASASPAGSRLDRRVGDER